MGRLRDRMAEDLLLRGLSPSTRRNYLLYCKKFAGFYGRSPEELGRSRNPLGDPQAYSMMTFK